MIEFVVLIPSILSALSCMFVIISYFIFERLRTPAGLFALWFSLAGVGNASYPFWGEHSSNSDFCVLQALIGTYFVLVTLFVSTILATFLHGIFFSSDMYKKSVGIRILWHHYFYAWICPGFLAVIPLLFNVYGKDRDDR